MIKRFLIIFGCSFFCATVFFSCSDTVEGNKTSFLQKMRNDIFGSSVKAKKKEKLNARDFVNWVEDAENGIKANKTIGNFTYSVLYKPYQYLALLELKKDSLTQQKIKEKTKEYDGYQYFTFRIVSEKKTDELLKVNLKSENEYYARLEYFSFNMQNDIKLIEGTDTLNCVLFHFERIYGLAPYATFVLGFPLTATEQKAQDKKRERMYIDKTILYNDKVFGAGNVYITIKAENLNSIPELVID